MTIFEYFLVLLSVILSLGIAHLATGIGELMRSRAAVRWSVPFALWTFCAFAQIVDVWASAWLLRGVVQWSLPAIVLMLLLSLATYLTALWLIPRSIGDEPIDLFDHVMAERRRFLGAMVVYNLLGVCVNLFLLPTGHFDWANYYTAIPLTAALMAAFLFSTRWVQQVMPWVSAGVLSLYFATYFSTIG